MRLAANPGPRYVARVPMMAAAVAFATGIVIERYVFHPIWFWTAAALALGAAVLYLYSRMQYRAYATALVALGCVGAFTSQAASSKAEPPATIVHYATGEPVTITGTVVRDGVLRTGAFGSPDESLDVVVESVAVGEEDLSASGGVRLSIYVPTKSREWREDSDEEVTEVPNPLPTYRYGQKIRVTAKLHLPLNYRNPGSFD